MNDGVRVETVMEYEDEDNTIAATNQAAILLFPGQYLYDGATGQAVPQTTEKDSEPPVSPTTTDTITPGAQAADNTASVVGVPGKEPSDSSLRASSRISCCRRERPLDWPILRERLLSRCGCRWRDCSVQ
jgi:hypothetical protein